jgi:hypothetical protein
MPQRNQRKGGPLPKQKGARKRKNKRNRPKSKSASMSYIPHLSAVAERYLLAITNPFMQMNEMPCIPDSLIVPSEKFVSISRGIFQPSMTTGFGFISMNPWLMAISDPAIVGASSRFPITFTTAAFTGTSYTFTIAGGAITTTGVVNSGTSSPYSVGFLEPEGDTTRQLRLVAAGLRIRYAGTELNRGGRALCYESEAVSSISQGSTTQSLLNDTRYSTTPINRQWMQTTYNPSNDDYISYEPFSAFDPLQSSPPNLLGAASLIVLLDAAITSAGPVNFEFEAISYFEIFGTNINHLTASHADSVGYGAILGALGTSVGSNAAATTASVYNSTLANIASTSSMLPSWSTVAGATGTVIAGGLARQLHKYARPRDFNPRGLN